MPGLTGVLIVTTWLAQANASPAPLSTAGTDAAVPRASAASTAQAQPGEGVPAPPTQRLHQVGFGVGLGSGGGGAAFRYFFGDQLGVNASAGFYRPNGAGNASSQGSTFYVAPSMVYILTKSHQMRAVDVRPYIGGGLNYATGGSQVRTASYVSSGGGMGMQVFGGAELTFQDAKSLAISAEVAHYQMAVSTYSAGLSQGTNFYLLFHYYMK